MSPIRLAVLLALSGAAVSSAVLPAPLVAQAGPQRVEIVLANFSFTPSEIRLAAGTPVTLHLVNRGSGGHNFMAREFFTAASMGCRHAHKTGHEGRGRTGQGRGYGHHADPAAGSYKVKCGYFLHAGFGMKGTITVS